MDVVSKIPMTIRHSYDFSAVPARIDQSELDAASWDALRESDSPFGFSATFTGAAEEAMRPRTSRILEVIQGLGAERVISYGVGAGLLERQLHEAGVDITCTEYAAGTRSQLERFLPMVLAHDLHDGPVAGFDLHILHRVDTELPDAEWRRYFQAVAETHLVVVATFVSRRVLVDEALRRLRGATKAGWLRTEPRFQQLLPRDAEPTQVAEFPAFLIRR